MAEESNEPVPQLLPAPVLRERSRGGRYDCDLVEPPPETIQADCPVCLLILKEPCLINCCGHKFCRECIEQVKKDDKPCPLCGKQDFTFMQERSLERILNILWATPDYPPYGISLNMRTIVDLLRDTTTAHAQQEGDTNTPLFLHNGREASSTSAASRTSRQTQRESRRI